MEAGAAALAVRAVVRWALVALAWAAFCSYADCAGCSTSLAGGRRCRRPPLLDIESCPDKILPVTPGSARKSSPPRAAAGGLAMPVHPIALRAVGG